MPRPPKSGSASPLSYRLGKTSEDTPGAGLANAAYTAIKEAIRSNRFEPGYHAGEVEIARQLGIPCIVAASRIASRGAMP